jgi:hypothetical protein
MSDDDTYPADDPGPPTQRWGPGDLEGEDTTRVIPGGTDEFPTRRFDPAAPLPVSESHTEILDIPPDPRGARTTGLAVAIVVLTFIVTALLGYSTRVPNPSGMVGRQLIGPDGGVITFDGPGRLEIQRGALSTATTITIRKVKLNQVVRLTRQNGEVKVFQPGSVPLYTFEPNNTTFNMPVTIRLPVQGGADSALVVAGNRVALVSGKQQGNIFVIQANNFEFK